MPNHSAEPYLSAHKYVIRNTKPLNQMYDIVGKTFVRQEKGIGHLCRQVISPTMGIGSRPKEQPCNYSTLKLKASKQRGHDCGDIDHFCLTEDFMGVDKVILRISRKAQLVQGTLIPFRIERIDRVALKQKEEKSRGGHGQMPEINRLQKCVLSVFYKGLSL